MKTAEIVEQGRWKRISALLPEDLAETARHHRALVRSREVNNADALMRMLLAYGVSDLSMKDTSAWARAQGVATMTAPSFFNRLRQSKDWLQVVLKQILQRHLESVSAASDAVNLHQEREQPFRLRVADATVVTGPAAKGVEWRVHTTVDPRSACVTCIELTDEHGGEGFSRLEVKPGDILLGDRCYAVARSIASVVKRGGYVVARLNPCSIRLCDRSRKVVPVYQWDSKVPEEGVVSFQLIVPVPPEGMGQGKKSNRTSEPHVWPNSQASDWIPVRVIASRTLKGNVIWVVTTLPESIADDITVLGLYRIRWQVELFFKRLKSLLHLDTLPSRRGPTAQSWILARLIAAALAQQLLSPVPSFSPWGYPLRKAGIRT